MGCRWSVSLSYKRLHRNQPEPQAWILCVKEDRLEHSHALQAHALSYEAHKARWPDYAEAQQMALTHRLSNLPYAESDRILANTPKEYDGDLHISKKKYYNLIPSTTRADQDILLGFLQSLEALDADDLIPKCRYEYVLNDGIPVKKILKQVYFLDTQQRRWTKRFCADFLVELDATFNTNKLKLLLLVAISLGERRYLQTIFRGS
ncbi:hypothetical protein N7G274_000305 [Stereocaulon virgatum]|uniref:Uncharacterized protein n=1 Tax=Stereocaulon virgatum TaxID=373712 RepID=A0ABR4AUU3_9LECA